MRLHKALPRAIVVSAAIAALTQSTGCSIVPARPDERTCEREKSEVLADLKDQTSSQFTKQCPEARVDRVTPGNSVSKEILGGFGKALFAPIAAPILGALAIGTLIVVIPTVAVSKAKASKSKQEKVANESGLENAAKETTCCFVWIEDGPTREAIVGKAPANR